MPLNILEQSLTTYDSMMAHFTDSRHFRVIPDISANARWSQIGVTVAGGNGYGSATKQLTYPCGLFVDNEKTIFVSDFANHRIVQWKKGDKNGQIVAGGQW
ncbi:unnamed protein product [Rotaria socialis]